MQICGLRKHKKGRPFLTFYLKLDLHVYVSCYPLHSLPSCLDCFKLLPSIHLSGVSALPSLYTMTSWCIIWYDCRATPCIYAFILCTVPSIWIMEYKTYEKRLAVAAGTFNLNCDMDKTRESFLNSTNDLKSLVRTLRTENICLITIIIVENTIISQLWWCSKSVKHYFEERNCNDQFRQSWWNNLLLLLGSFLLLQVHLLLVCIFSNFLWYWHPLR